MGKMALIIVVGLSMTVGIVGYTLNKSKTGLVENVAGFAKYTNCRNIAHTGVNMMLRKLDRNDSSFVNPLQRGQMTWLVANVMSGLCSVSVKLANPAFLDTVLLTSKSYLMDTSYSMKLRLRRSPIPFPAIGAAIGVRAAPAAVQVNGNVTVDGHNYDSTGTTKVGWGDVEGLALMNKTDSANVSIKGGANIYGNSGTDPNIAVDTTTVDPGPYMSDYEAAADYVFNTPGTIAGAKTFGTLTMPVIVVCNAGEDTTFSIKFTGPVSGCGILAVNGSVNFSGGINWTGLIIAYGQNNVVNFSMSGTSSIVGGVLVAGVENATLKLTGNNGKVEYSSSALNIAKYINKLQVYRVQWWYE